MAYPLFKIWDPTNALQIINQIIQDINALILSGGNSVGVNGVPGVSNISFTGAGVSVSGGAPTSTVNIPGGAAIVPVAEAVTVTGVNTLAPLAHIPLSNPITLMINGRGFFPIGSSPDFSVSGNTITWLSSIYAVSMSDHVIALYYYAG